MDLVQLVIVGDVLAQKWGSNCSARTLMAGVMVSARTLFLRAYCRADLTLFIMGPTMDTTRGLLISSVILYMNSFFLDRVLGGLTQV